MVSNLRTHRAEANALSVPRKPRPQAPVGARALPDALGRHLALFRLVNEVMADDLSLAEQLRAAVTALWLAAQHTEDPDGGQVARRDLVRAEEVLRGRLYRAMRSGVISQKRFDESMALLRASQPLAQLPIV